MSQATNQGMDQPKRTKNDKNGSKFKIVESLGKCVKCQKKNIPSVQEALNANLDMPDALKRLIGEYIETPYSDFYVLHPPARRRNHVICVKCYRKICDTTFDTLPCNSCGRIHTEFICFDRNCTARIRFDELIQSTVDDVKYP